LGKYGEKLKPATRIYKTPSKGEVAIKVICSTIHPADLFFGMGLYGNKQPDVFPIVPGFEGSGEIVEVGEGVDSSYKGKRCGFFANSNKTGTFEGTWSQYFYANVKQIMVFEGNVDYEKICFSMINPLTAAGFIDTLQRKNQVAVAQNAANSAVGKIMIRFCKLKGIKTINLVRKEDQIESLKKLGADYVISTSATNWKEEFHKISAELGVQSFFECVGGDMTASVLSLLPDGATVYHYGNLEGKPITGVNTSDLIFKRKKLEGWWLATWAEEVGPQEFFKWAGFIIQEFSKGSDIFDTAISKRVKLEEVNEAKDFYFGGNMSLGKVIINPN